MPSNLHVQSGENLRLPVPDTDPLAVHQSFRLPTHEEVSAHPFWSKVVAVRTAQLPKALSDSVIPSIIRNIGWITSYNWTGILIEPGATLTFTGAWQELTADVVTISAASGNLPPGRIRISYADPTISASFTLNCTTLTGGGY